MKIEQALDLINQVLFKMQQRKLSDVESLILQGSWERKTYAKIADSSNYSLNYLRKDVGAKLWQDLTSVMGEPLSKTNFRAALERQWQKQQQAVVTTHDVSKIDCLIRPQVEWGDAIDVSGFLGRSTEQEELTQWITGDRCRMVMLLGMGGMGKTALAIKVAQQLQSNFEFVIWRSLRHAPPLIELLTDLNQFLKTPIDLESPQSEEVGMTHLLQFLRQHRCLLILDNIDAILQEGDRSYQLGYEGYEQLFRCIGDIPHQSCLLTTSRELPQQLDIHLGQKLPQRSFTLSGLSVDDGRRLFDTIGSFRGSSLEWQVLMEHYAGNPLALKIVASFISEVCGGELRSCLEFIGPSPYIFDDIKKLFDQQFQRLNFQEKALMIGLARKRKPTCIQELPKELNPPLPPHKLLQTLTGLKRRSLIENINSQFRLRPMVLEYITCHVI